MNTPRLVHFLMRYMWVALLLPAQAAAWRFGDHWWGTAGSIALLLLALIQSQRLEQGWRAHQVLCFSMALALCLIAAFTDWFPCSAGCSNGEAYSLIFGYDTLYFASAAYGLAILVLLFNRGAHPGFFSHAVVWLFFGNSLFFLGLSAWLQMICPLCLSVHSCVLAAAIFGWPHRGSMALCLSWTALGAALIAGVFGLQLRYGAVDSSSDPGEQVLTPQNGASSNPFGQLPQQQQLDQALIDRINRGRSIGQENAPCTLSVFIRLGCNHCASVVPQIIKDAKNLTADGTLKIRFHYIMNRFSAENLDRHYMALSAAIDGKFLLAQTALLGNEAAAIGFEESLRTFDIDPAALRRRIQQHKNEFNALREQDKQLFSRAGGTGTTPAFLLYDGQTLLQQWDSELSWQDLKKDMQQTITAQTEH